MPIELVIFDCDGVLVDSEALVVDVEASLLTDAGYPVTPQELIDRFVGLSYPTMMAQIEADLGRPLPDGLSDQIQAAAMERLATDLEPVVGMDVLLEGLTHRRCVASSSDLDRITLSLRTTGLATHFEPASLFSAQMVERPKPAPDLFLLAAERCGVAPERCVVIEDSPHGVAGATAAEMTVVGLTAGRHASAALPNRLRDAGATEVFASADALSSYLATA